MHREIPSDVFEAAMRAADAAFPATYMNAGPLYDHFARAIMAERERCAKIVEDYTTTTRRDVAEVLVRRKTASINSIGLASAIRNGVSK